MYIPTTQIKIIIINGSDACNTDQVPSTSSWVTDPVFQFTNIAAMSHIIILFLCSMLMYVPIQGAVTARFYECNTFCSVK